jgi:hypothetical protein
MDRITAALEEIITDIQITIDRLSRAQGEPDAKAEKKYFTAQRNAYVRALRMHQDGVRVVWNGRSATVASATRAAVVHRLWKEGGIWRCSCEAGTEGIFCRHHALVEGHERAGEIADRDDDGLDAAAAGGGSFDDGAVGRLDEADWASLFTRVITFAESDHLVW